MCRLGKYVYGIIDNVDNEMIKDIKGIDGLHSLYSLKTEDVYIILSNVDLEEYGEGELDKRLEDMAWVEEKAKKHFNIVQSLLEYGTVIPMKFCTIFVSDDTMLQFVDSFKFKIKEAISYLKDKEEWDLKVYCDRKKFLECNMEEEREAMKTQIGKAAKGAAYFLAKKIETNLEEKTREKIIKIKDTLWNDLKENAEQVKLNKNLSKQVMEYDKDMILNGAFLIKKDDKDTFMDAIDKKKAFFEKYNMEIKLSGPWPFYNFSTSFIA